MLNRWVSGSVSYRPGPNAETDNAILETKILEVDLLSSQVWLSEGLAQQI